MVIFVRGNATCSMHDTKIFKRPPVRGGVGLPGSASPFFMRLRLSILRSETTRRFARQQPPQRVTAASGHRRVEHQIEAFWLKGPLQEQPAISNLCRSVRLLANRYPQRPRPRGSPDYYPNHDTSCTCRVLWKVAISSNPAAAFLLHR